MDICVEEFTTPVLYTVKFDCSLDETIDMMAEHQVRHLPVVKDGKVIGIVSQRDVLATYGKSWSEVLRVEDIMNENILTVNISDNLGEVAFKLSDEKVGSALVLDNNGKIYGIFTTTDALNALVEIIYPDAAKKSDLSI